LLHCASSPEMRTLATARSCIRCMRCASVAGTPAGEARSGMGELGCEVRLKSDACARARRAELAESVRG